MSGKSCIPEIGSRTASPSHNLSLRERSQRLSAYKQETIPLTPYNHDSRRKFLKGGIAAAGLATFSPAILSAQAVAQPNTSTTTPPPGDVAILKFLAAVELVETDLWTQYSLLAANNSGFNQGLKNIDPALVRYNHDILRDESSHAVFINTALEAVGQTPTNLDAFKTLKMPQVQGASDAGFITNLTDLTVDTSWYTKLRANANPDFGTPPIQLVDLNGIPTIPPVNGLSPNEYQGLANAATFHSASIDEAGTSLYAHFLSKASDVRVVNILACILPVEAIHFTGFNKALENMPGVDVDSVTFPNLRAYPDYAQGIFPTPCSFVDSALPTISVIRPVNSPNVGAVALVKKLVASGLFKGQSNAFMDSTMMLAEAADGAQRSV